MTRASAEPHLSVSQISTFQQCPRKYRFQQIDRLPWPAVPSTLLFGTAIHHAMAVLSEARLQGLNPDLPLLHDAYRVAWAAETKPVEMKDGETPEALDAMARALLAEALAQPMLGRVVAVEEPFRVLIGDGLPPVIGVIDLVEERDGRTVIVEHKTAAQRFTEQRVADDHQATVYALAALQMGLPGVVSVGDVEVRFNVLLKLKKPTIDERPTRRTDRHVAELLEVAEAVWTSRELGLFPPLRGWHCSGCPFRQPCGS